MNNMSFGDRLKHAWNAFFSRDPTYEYYGESSYYRPDRPRFKSVSERTIITSIYNRIAMDVAAIDIVHARLDEEGRYLETINSSLNNCLTVEANLDQTGRAFIQDVVMSMFDEGCVGIVPVETTDNPIRTGGYDILSMRTGKIIEWFPENVKLRVYNERTGRYEDIVLPKRSVAIVENPLYSVINEPNSTMQRLIRKLSLLDYVDEQNSSSKLNMIIQLPYIVKTESRRQQAENRRKDIEKQLGESKYGIAYTDGTEKITQLSHPLENNLLAQVEYLTKLLYSQLGLSEEILNGSADEKAMLNYHNRTIEPIVSEIVNNMKRKFLTKTARSQHQSIIFFRNPFKLVTISEIADIGDRFTRNEIMTSNEIRQIIGMKPSDDPSADELRNKNLYDVDGDGIPDIDPSDLENLGLEEDAEENQNGENEEEVEQEDDDDLYKDIDDLDEQLDELLRMLDEDELKHYASPYYDPVKAHEYYMDHRKLVGRKSTASLNDEGKAAAKYVKKRLTEERKGKEARNKELLKSTINSLNAYKKNQIAKSREETNKDISNLSDYVKSILETNSQGLKTKVSRLSDSKNADVKKNTEQTNSNIERLRAQKQANIESHKKATQSKIDSLYEKLKNMSSGDKAAQKESIRAQIADLRAKNSAKREELSNAFKENSSKLRDENKKYRDTKNQTHKENVAKEKAAVKEDNAAIRSSQKSTNEGYRERHKSNSEKASSEYKTKAASARSESKEYRNKLKEEYDKKYESELENIRNEESFKKQKKAKSSGGSSRGGSGKSTPSAPGGSARERYYRDHYSDVKAFYKKKKKS